MPFNVAGAKAAGYSDQEIQSYLASKQQSLAPQPQAQTSQPQGGGLLHSLLPTALGIGGTLLGMPFGPWGMIGLGAGGSALGSALTGGTPGDILKEGALGAVGGLFPAFKGAKLLGVGARAAEEAGAQGAERAFYQGGRTAPFIGFPQATEQAATEATTRAGTGLAAKTLASNFIVPTKSGRAGINIEDALRQAIQDKTIPGPLSMGGYKTLSNDIVQGITKGRQFIANNVQAPINYEQPLSDAVSFSKQVGEIEKDTVPTIRGFFDGRAPTGIGTISATDAHDVAQQLENEGYNLINAYGPKAATPNLAKANKGDIMVGVAQDLRAQIDRAAQNEGLLEPMKKQIIDQLGGKYPAVEAKIQQAISVPEIRSIAAAYVNISKAVDSTIIAHQAPFNRGGEQLGLRLAGAGAGFGVGHIPGAIIGAMTAPAAAGIGQAAQPALSSLAARGILGGAGAATKFGPTVLGQAGAHALGGLGAPTVPSGPDNIGNTQTNQQSGANIHDQTISQNTPESQGPISQQDLLRQKLGAYILSRARNANDLVQGYNLLYPKPAQNRMTSEEKTALDSNLDKFAQTYNNMSPVQRMNPLDPQNRQLQTIRTLMVAEVRKAMVGGRATQQELTWIMNLLPPLNHPVAAIYPSETVNAAIDQLKSSIGVSMPQNLGLPFPANYLGMGQ